MLPSEYELRVTLDKASTYSLVFHNKTISNPRHTLDALPCTIGELAGKLLKFQSKVKGYTYLSISRTHGVQTLPSICALLHSIQGIGKFKIEFKDLEIDEPTLDLLTAFVRKGVKIINTTLPFELLSQAESLCQRSK